MLKMRHDDYRPIFIAESPNMHGLRIQSEVNSWNGRSTEPETQKHYLVTQSFLTFEAHCFLRQAAKKTISMLTKTLKTKAGKKEGRQAGS